MRKTYMLLLAVILTFTFSSVSFGADCTAGSMSTSLVGHFTASDHEITILQLDLTSDASGDVNGTANCQISLGDAAYVQKVEVWPDTSPTTPTAYNCRLNTPLGNDIMQGALQTLPTVNTVSTGMYQPLIGGSLMPSLSYSPLSVVCDTMGASKGATLDVHIYTPN